MTRRDSQRIAVGGRETAGAGRASGAEAGPASPAARRPLVGAGPSGRRPSFSMRARTVLRVIPSTAAVREMFQPVCWRTARMCSRRASSSERGGGTTGVGAAASSRTGANRWYSSFNQGDPFTLP